MEYPYTHRDEDFPVIGDVLDAVKTARYQFGTLAHMGEDLEHSVAGLRAWLAGLQRFFSDSRNVAYTAASVIAAAALLNHLRGWVSARRAWGHPGAFVREMSRLI